MINEAISKLVDGQDLTRAEMIAVMDEIMGGEADSIQTAGLLTALQIKGATIEEITASAISMRNHADVMDTNVDITEIVGTGGDKSNSFNISLVFPVIISLFCFNSSIFEAPTRNIAVFSSCVN